MSVLWQEQEYTNDRLKKRDATNHLLCAGYRKSCSMSGLPWSAIRSLFWLHERTETWLFSQTLSQCCPFTCRMRRRAMYPVPLLRPRVAPSLSSRFHTFTLLPFRAFPCKKSPRNTDFICGNQKRTANPYCTLSCGIGRDFHI